MLCYYGDEILHFRAPSFNYNSPRHNEFKILSWEEEMGQNTFVKCEVRPVNPLLLWRLGPIRWLPILSIVIERKKEEPGGRMASV